MVECRGKNECIQYLLLGKKCHYNNDNSELKKEKNMNLLAAASAFFLRTEGTHNDVINFNIIIIHNMTIVKLQMNPSIIDKSFGNLKELFTLDIMHVGLCEDFLYIFLKQPEKKSPIFPSNFTFVY